MALPVDTPPRLDSAVAAVVAFVPPFAMGNVPVTLVVKDIFETVLFDPFMVLLVRVSEPAKVANVPVVGKVTFVAAVSVLVYAKFPEPVTVIAALFATPVPPLFAGKVPVTFDAKLTKVVDVEPVPPEATGNAEPSVKEVKYEAASTTFVPLL